MRPSCCIPGCKSNYKSAVKAGEKLVSVFRFPRDDSLRAKWLSAIPRTARPLSSSASVCRLHFKDSDLIKWYKHFLKDKTLQNNPTRVRLKPNAVPSIFPNLPRDIPGPSLQPFSYSVVVIQVADIKTECTSENLQCSILSGSDSSLTLGHLSGSNEHAPLSDNHSEIKKSQKEYASEREELPPISESRPKIKEECSSENEEYSPPSDNHSEIKKSQKKYASEREELPPISESCPKIKEEYSSENEEYSPPSENHSEIKISEKELSLVSESLPKIKEEYSSENEEYSPDSVEVKIEYTPISVKYEPQLSDNVEEVSQGLNEIWENTSTEHEANSNLPLLRCTICPYETTDETYFFVHKKIHRNVYSCDSCHYISSSESKLKLHKRRHMKPEDLLNYCKECPFTAVYLKDIRLHWQQEHVKRRRGTLECPKCSFITSRSIYLVKHQIQKHNDPFFQCKSCRKFFLDEAEYKNHSLRHAEKWPRQKRP